MENEQKSNQINIVLDHKHAVSPRKAHPSDIGYDLTAIGVDKVVSDRIVLFETGIRVCPPKGYYIEIVPRSSISKSGYILANSVGTIDPDYTGTLKIALIKVDEKMPDITLPFTLCQMVLRKAEESQLLFVTNLESTERGEGCFGSSNEFTYLHSFRGKEGEVLNEIKHGSKYMWKWKNKEGEDIHLTYIGGEKNIRKFEEGYLIFDDKNAMFNFCNVVYKLKKCS